jgi:type I restriction enzyme R subunit
MSLNEAETRAEYIDPALELSGWGKNGSRIRREFFITKGRILTGGVRGKALKADYVLEFKGKRLAVVEAKPLDVHHTEGVAQAILYAEKLSIPITFATNGKKIRQIIISNNSQVDIDVYPTPDELISLINEPDNQLNSKLQSTDYELKNNEPVRYYQQIAVERTLKSIAEGKKRMLLTLATGTGKTRIAFHIAWKLFQNRWNLGGESNRRSRILFLADRNILANQAYNEFSQFPEDALVRITPKDIQKKGEVPKNGNIFFTIFATFMTSSKGDKPTFNFYGYPKDFFDLIIVDECHRGGANSESQWRGILDYFSDAVQIGLTATPKRKDNVDTYSYFGEPLYTYSLKDGIEDGFLTPFRVVKYQTTIDEYVYEPDDEVLEGEIEEGAVYQEKDFNKKIFIEERERFRIKKLFEIMNLKEKTLVFCANQDHALIIRDLINEEAKDRNPLYCVRVTANDQEIGEQYLRDFQDNEKTIPTILTTSKKLSTGVDARNVRNIVLLRPINNMIEFKQIIGRGTRLFDGKDFFTIHDFVNASFNFNDPEWDGEPTEPVDGPYSPPSPPTPSSVTDEDDDKDDARPMKRMVVVELGEGKELELQGMTTQRFYSVDGKVITLSDFVRSLFDKLPEFFKTEEELRSIWSSPETRRVLLDQLRESGFPRENLEAIQKLVNAENSDIFDLLEYVRFQFKPIERSVRALRSRQEMEDSYDAKTLDFVDFLVGQYTQSGVEELDENKLPILLEIKYKDIYEGTSMLGGVNRAREVFLEFQKNLYLPHSQYSLV